MKTKQKKHEEAKIRQEKYDSLTIDEKLMLSKSRRGLSFKERTRLWRKFDILFGEKNG